EQRMGDAADLVLDGEQVAPAFRVDDVAETVLEAIVLGRDEAALREPGMGAGEVRDVDLNVVIIELRERLVGFTKQEMLVLANPDGGHGSVAVCDLRGRVDHVAIKAADAAGGADRHVELDIGHSERDPPETGSIGLMAADAIAPGADGLDVIVVLAEIEPGP